MTKTDNYDGDDETSPEMQVGCRDTKENCHQYRNSAIFHAAADAYCSCLCLPLWMSTSLRLWTSTTQSTISLRLEHHHHHHHHHHFCFYANSLRNDVVLWQSYSTQLVSAKSSQCMTSHFGQLSLANLG